MTKGFGFAIDRGGTFTDIFVRRPDGSSRVLKLLSEDPANYADAPTEGIRRVLEEELGVSMPREEPVDASSISWIRMGTTVATNALLERKGERMALAITRGFRDLLYIGNQSRPKLFDLKIEIPEILYDVVVEVPERVVLKQEKCQLDTKGKVVEGSTGEKLEIWENVDREALKRELQAVKRTGIRSLAVVLLHSYMYPEHEIEVGKLAEEIGFTNVSLSSQIMPMVKAVPRGFTACADAYLTPVIQRYIAGFTKGFKNNLQGVQVLFMQSDGGLCPVKSFFGSRAILSGPAGGVIGISLTSYDQVKKQPVIGFDMGGTSTDVSRYAGEYDHVFETTTAGVTIQAPQLDVNTVAAGGGSRLFYRSGLFVVGPDSAGANPGPVCYRKNGHLAITDANVVLGRLLPQYFPKIFGPKENESLDCDAARHALEAVTKEINNFNLSGAGSGKRMTVEDVALGFVDVANEAMCRPIRALTQAKGFDTSQHALACFGGAGGQHACAIAKSLGMKTVLVHRHAGILSAYGLALADVVHEAQEPCSTVYEPKSFKFFDDRLAALSKRCIDELTSQGFDEKYIETEAYLHMRYDRTDCALMCSVKNHPTIKGKTPQHGDFMQSFLDSYKREFGFVIADRPVIVADIRVRGVGKIGISDERTITKAAQTPRVDFTTKCYFKDGYQNTNVYLLSDLLAGHSVDGPALIIDANCTILVEPNCKASITEQGNVHVAVGDAGIKEIGTEIDSIQLSIFSHRFMSIAEQMGRILQRTAISTNIKERLDFSCALFGPDGGLIANAPHIPVHLGAMQETVRFQMNHIGDKIRDGDVYLSNHPCAGGSHLPDFTVITPVFYKKSSKPVFYVAARGHHADIGGLVPGSMPPHSTRLEQEGAAFYSFKIVDKGTFQEDELVKALQEPGKVAGCSGSRNIDDNISDLRAQVAANNKGIQLVCDLIDIYGLDVVQAYMAHIQQNAELAVRDLLREVAQDTVKRTGESTLHALDYMDDGTPIKLTVKIDAEKGEAVFDFTGTGAEVYNSCNAPRAITQSAIIYCLRCMVGHDIPLNQGCLNPIEVVLPESCILNPSPDAAVVGGNVLTSQRVVDVIMRAFAVCAASQGCMNNITFGDEAFGYYETVAGGAGAGPGWPGRSGVHTHMTNTKITDPEIVERRYPVVLKQFGLRKDSGGAGQWRGGDGTVREYLFRKPMTLSVLTERRVFQPYGCNGGQPGKCGLNLFCYQSGRIVNLGAKASVPVSTGDSFVLNTPGGGGWGDHDPNAEKKPGILDKIVQSFPRAIGSLHAYIQTQESA